jgi:hypothetical protein
VVEPVAAAISPAAKLSRHLARTNREQDREPRSVLAGRHPLL